MRTSSKFLKSLLLNEDLNTCRLLFLCLVSLSVLLLTQGVHFSPSEYLFRDLNYALLLTKDPPVLPMLVSVPSFQHSVQLVTQDLHCSPGEYICPRSDLWLDPFSQNPLLSK